jgi:hypothetical protein
MGLRAFVRLVRVGLGRCRMVDEAATAVTGGC